MYRTDKIRTVNAMPPTKLPKLNFVPLYSLAFMIVVIVTDEEIDVVKLL